LPPRRQKDQLDTGKKRPEEGDYRAKYIRTREAWKRREGQGEKGRRRKETERSESRERRRGESERKEEHAQTVETGAGDQGDVDIKSAD